MAIVIVIIGTIFIILLINLADAVDTLAGLLTLVSSVIDGTITGPVTISIALAAAVTVILRTELSLRGLMGILIIPGLISVRGIVLVALLVLAFLDVDHVGLKLSHEVSKFVNALVDRGRIISLLKGRVADSSPRLVIG